MNRARETSLLAKAVLIILVTFGMQAKGEGTTIPLLQEGYCPSPLDETSLQLDLPQQTQVSIGGHAIASGALSDGSIPLVGEPVVVTFISPEGASYEENVMTDEQGRFSCEYLPYSVGDWSFEAHYEGSAQHAPASAPAQDFAVTPADTFLTVDLSADSIVAGTSLRVKGALRCPDYVAPDSQLLDGQEISLHLYEPSGTLVDTISVTTTETGQYIFPEVFLPSTGTWNLRLEFAGDDNLNPSSSGPFPVRARPSAGYAIIVAGKVPGGNGLDCHNKTTDRAYTTFKKRGFADKDIFYFRYGTPSDPGIVADEEPRQNPDDGGHVGIREAIRTWARDKMNSSSGPLYILFVNHGNTEKFYVDPSAAEFEDRIIDPVELDEWISQLEASLAGDAIQENILFIYGACYAGSFLPLVSGEGKRRIIIASADPNEPSFKGPMEDDGVRDGEFFVSQLFASLGTGENVKGSFELATEVIEAYTSNASGNGGVSTVPYADDAAQHPLLDDNGDSLGSNDALSTYPGNDGAVSAKVILGYQATTAEALRLTSVSESKHLGPGEPDPSLQARVNDADSVAEIWVAIKPPGFDLGKPPETMSEQREVVVPELDFDSQPEAGTFELYNFNKGDFSGFTAPGRYEILYFVKDAQSGGISVFKRSFVYRNLNAGDEPPQAFDLLSPQDNSIQNTVLFLDWQDSRDPENQAVSYTVEISTDPTFSQSEFVIQGIDGSGTMIDESVGLKDLTLYFWRVFALDPTGNRTFSSQSLSFNTNDTNGWGNYNVLTEIVRNRNDPATWPPDSCIEIHPYVGKLYNHYYSALVPLGSYSVDSEAPCFSHEHDDVDVIEESPTTVLQLPEPAAAVVFGTVNDAVTLSPIRGATVRLEVLSGIHSGAEFTACSEEDGGFHLPDLFGAVDYQVTVEKNSYDPYENTLSLAAGENRNLGTLPIGFDDADNDELADGFEQLIVDADPEDEIEDIWDVLGTDDFDGDGFSNGEEFAASTDPTSSESFLRIIAIFKEADGDVTITWASVPGVYYEVHHADDLAAWGKAAGPIAASGSGSTSWTDDGFGTAPPPLEAANRFYYVEIF